MKVFYATSPKVVSKLNLDSLCVVFVPDTYGSGHKYYWDDFGYKTTCSVYVVDDSSESSHLGYAKMLLEGEKNTHERMKEIVGESGYIALERLECKYLTLPDGRDFYTKLKKITPTSLISYFQQSRDAGYLDYSDRSQLFESPGFEDSLLREIGARKAFGFAKKNAGYAEYNDIDFEVRYQLDSFDEEHVVGFDFTEGFYPANINLLIGPNGAGKTQGLFTLMQDMLDIGESRRKRKESSDSSLKPFFSNVVCFSYSPFENIEDVVGENDIRSSSIFKAFSFYQDGTFDKDNPVVSTVHSLFDILSKDAADGVFQVHSERFTSLKEIMRIGIPDFDDIGVVVSEPDGGERVLPVGDDYEGLLTRKDDVVVRHGAVYIKDDQKIKLSSGQSMFSTLVLGALSHIKEETLLVFDEPELYLHPSLEIVLLRMLRALLERYDSYAVISTHSLVLAREVPQRCTSVLKRRDSVPVVERPPFETFGASMDRINAYVFDDTKGIKKYHEFLDTTYDRYGSFEKTMTAAKSKLNEESILYLMGKE